MTKVLKSLNVESKVSKDLGLLLLSSFSPPSYFFFTVFQIKSI